MVSGRKLYLNNAFEILLKWKIPSGSKTNLYANPFLFEKIDFVSLLYPIQRPIIVDTLNFH